MSSVSNRFQGILNMIVRDWVLELFLNPQTTELSLHELIELPTNKELKLISKKGYQALRFQRQIPELYPALLAASRKFSLHSHRHI